MNKDEQYLAEAYSRVYLKEDADFQDQMPDSTEKMEHANGEESPNDSHEYKVGDYIMDEDGDEYGVLSVSPDGDLIVIVSGGPKAGLKKLVTKEELHNGAYLPDPLKPTI